VEKARQRYEELGSRRRVSSAQISAARTLLELSRLEEARDLLYTLLAPDSPIVRDCWRVLEVQVLLLLLDVSRGLKNLHDLVACSLRLVEPLMPLPLEKKKTLQADLGLLLTGFPLQLPPWSALRALPAPVQDLSWARLDAPVLLWGQQGALAAHVATFEASFDSSKEVYQVGEKLPLRLTLASALVEPVLLSRIDVSFQDDRYSLVLHASSTGELEEGTVRAGAHVAAHETLELLPSKATVFRVDLPAPKASAALCVTHVTLHWGAGPCSLQLPARPRLPTSASAAGDSGARAHNIAPSPSPSAGAASAAGDWEKRVGGGARGARAGGDGWDVVRVAETEPDASLDLSCKSPGLLGEKLRVSICVGAKAGCSVDKAVLTLLAVPEQQGAGATAAVSLSLHDHLAASHDGTATENNASIDIAAIAGGGEVRLWGMVTVVGEGLASVRLRAVLVYNHGVDGQDGVRVERERCVPLVAALTSHVTYAAATSLQCLQGSAPAAAQTPAGTAQSTPRGGSEPEAVVSAPSGGGTSSGPAVAGEALLIKVAVSVVSPEGLRLMGAQLDLAAGAARFAAETPDGSGGGGGGGGRLPTGGLQLEAGDRYTFLFSVIPEEPVSGGALMNVAGKEVPAAGATAGATAGVTAPIQVALGRSVRLLMRRCATFLGPSSLLATAFLLLSCVSLLSRHSRLQFQAPDRGALRGRSRFFFLAPAASVCATPVAADAGACLHGARGGWGLRCRFFVDPTYILD